MDTQNNMEQTNNGSPMEINQEVSKKENKGGGIGPVIGSIIIIVLILLGGLYYLGSLDKAPKVEAPVIENEQSQDPEIAEIEEVLDSTNLDELDKELDSIEAEINAELENI